MGFVESEIIINAPVEKAYSLAKNMESFPDFMKDVKEVKVIKKEGNKTITKWVSDVDGTPIIWTEEDIFYDDKFSIEYKLIEGDLDKFEGVWKFNKIDDNKTKVYLSVDFDFGIPNLAALIGPTLNIKVRENSEMMLDGMKKYLEKEV